MWPRLLVVMRISGKRQPTAVDDAARAATAAPGPAHKTPRRRPAAGLNINGQCLH